MTSSGNIYIRMTAVLVVAFSLFILIEFIKSLFDDSLSFSTLMNSIGIIGSSLAILLVALYLYVRLSVSYPRAFNVAIIGFPKSGKTSLIVSLFQEIFSRKVSKVKAILRGESTIERVNDLIYKKESGLPVGPTNDQSMFAYRTNIESDFLFFKKEYKVEFGDYPGEYSEELSNQLYFETLRKSEFFKWCVDADAYIFVIDIGKYLIEKDKKNFIAISTKAIRESWQHFQDYSAEANKKMRNKPLLLVFNKMDLIEYCFYDKNDYFFQVAGAEVNVDIDRIINNGFSESKVPDVIELNAEIYNAFSKDIEYDFKSLILYLKSESDHFHILYASSFGTINKRFAGVNNILKFILPL
jgi:GTPase SAR1 family protein